MSLFVTISAWLKATLIPYGGLGLMLLALGDSSFLSLPEVNDVLLMTFSIDQPASMVKFATLTMIGSVIGSAMLFAVARAGGDALLRKRGSDDRLVERIRHWYGRFGILAVIIPSLLPPPTPFKVFVLAAGAFGISWPRFIVALIIGRSIRYFGEGFLAVKYGSAAIDFARQNFGKIGIGLAAVIVTCVVIFALAKRRDRHVEAQ